MIKRKRAKKIITAQDAAKIAADKFLQPIIDGTAGEYGSKRQLAVAMGKKLGQPPVSRYVMERWLNPDPTKRQQPLLGSGLILRSTWDEQQKKQNKKEKKK